MTKPDTQTETVAAPVHVPFDETLRQAWARYGNAIYVVCALIALGIIAKGTWDYLSAQREIGIEREYAACVSPDSFKAFALSHPGHALTGLAELKVADDSFATNHFDEARTHYQNAVAILADGPFRSHAQLGLAVSNAALGKSAEAEAGFKQLMNDTTQLKAIRCEAGFHLASIAADAGRAAEVQTLAEQLLSIDPNSPFAERAFSLRSEMAAK